MRKELCDVRISFRDGQGATIERLTVEQQKQLSAILEASGCRYLWNAWQVEPATRNGRLSWLWKWIDERWRRLAAWMAPMLILAVLSVTVAAQDKKHSVRISAENSELTRLLHDELTNSNVAVVTKKRGDYEVTAAIAPLGEDAGCRGVIGVLLIEGRDGRILSAFIASDLGQLARQMAEKLAEETRRK